MNLGLNYIYVSTFSHYSHVPPYCLIITIQYLLLRLRKNHYLSISPSSLFPVLPCKQTVWREPSASLLKVIICRHLDRGCLVSRTLRNGYLLCEHLIQDSLFKQSVWLRYYFNKINTIVLPYPHLYFAHLWLPTVTCGLKRLNVKFQRKQSMCLQLHSILSGAMK